jgi:hypothetical protein
MINPSKSERPEIEKENEDSRDGATTTRARDVKMVMKMEALTSNQQRSAFEAHGFITSRSKHTIKF